MPLSLESDFGSSCVIRHFRVQSHMFHAERYRVREEVDKIHKGTIVSDPKCRRVLQLLSQVDVQYRCF